MSSLEKSSLPYSRMWANLQWRRKVVISSYVTGGIVLLCGLILSLSEDAFLGSASETSLFLRPIWTRVFALSALYTFVALAYASAFRCPRCQRLFLRPFGRGIEHDIVNPDYQCPHCGLKNGSCEV